MRVLVHANDVEVERLLVDAAGASRFHVEPLPSLAEFRTALFRDHDAIGVIWTVSPDFARITMRDFRMDGIRSPVIVLLEHPDNYVSEARVSQTISILGLGADDVQPFPIDQRELTARLDALARRERSPIADIVHLPNEALYRPDIGRVFFPGGTIWLTGKECSLFNTLTARPDVTFSKEMLLDTIYGGRDEPALKILDVFICKLRRKLTLALGDMDVIETVWGRGWRFRPEGFQPIYSAQHNARRVG